MSAALAPPRGVDVSLSLRSAAIEVAPLPPERLLAMAGDPAAAFIAPGGEAWVGLGAVRWLPSPESGPEALWAGLLDETPQAPAPVALGCWPFRLGEPVDAVWQGLMPGGLALPQRLYTQSAGRAWWRITVPIADAEPLQRRLVRERTALAALAAIERQDLPAWQDVGEGSAPARYVDAVTKAVDEIRRGGIEKVVLARRARVEFDSAPEPAALLSRLGARHPDCVRYAWRRGLKTWLGASPETLARLDGRRLCTQALAGTRTTEHAADLLSSAKERREHAIVVDALRRAVAPLTESMPPPLNPVIRHLRGIAHLHTPIEALMRDEVDLLRIVRALHPTPAVCGLPAAAAAQWLRVLEPDPRGLYAGPFMRLHPEGGGHAVVSLRGAVIEDRVAVLPAGAGIVDGSEGDAELAETRVKQRSVLDAFQGRP